MIVLKTKGIRSMRRIFLLCPGNSVTGGPEALHQLALALNEFGQDARVVYYPFDGEFDTPLPYQSYSPRIARYSEITSDDVVIVPETRTKFIKPLPTSKVVVWWLSIDHYYGYPLSTPSFLSRFNHFFRIIKGRKLSLGQMSTCLHISQSEYAVQHLLSKGLSSIKVTDYLNQVHTSSHSEFAIKKPKVLFNPKKGYIHTSKLISACPDIEFIRIENMTASEVHSLLNESMIYIDFGNHPGMDRLPREAALAGCAVITGRQGAANFTQDVSIPDAFKINEFDDSFESNFREVALNVLENFEQVTLEFDDYRKKIIHGKQLFEEEVSAFIAELDKSF